MQYAASLWDRHSMLRLPAKDASAHQDLPPDVGRYLGREQSCPLSRPHKAVPNERQYKGPHSNLHSQQCHA